MFNIMIIADIRDNNSSAQSKNQVISNSNIFGHMTSLQQNKKKKKSFIIITKDRDNSY